MKNAVEHSIPSIFSIVAKALGFFKVPTVLAMAVWLSACSISIVDAVSSEPSYVEVSESLSEAEIQQAQLQQILAPIALYPDSLLTHILIASTYPLEVVMASQLQRDNQYLDAVELMDKAEPMGWDPSVTALLAFPTVLEKLSGDLNWTQQLGEAFLEDEAHLMANIQLLRAQAEQADSFADLEHLSVTRENNQIIIEPVRREIVYVPYYDTRVVYGHWRWRHYQPVYWTPFYGYAVFPRHRFHWGHGIRIRTNFFFSAFHWVDRRVVVVNHHHTHIYRPRVHITHDHKSRRWHHKPHHRRGVAYRNAKVKEHYRDHKKVRHHHRNELHDHQQDLHISHSDRDRHRSVAKRQHTSEPVLTNKQIAKAREERIAHQFNHRGEHVPERGPRHKSAKIDRELKKSPGPKVVTKSDLYTIPGNKHATGKTKNSTPGEIAPKKPVEKAPKRPQNQDLHTTPGNKYASGRSKHSTPREMTSKKPVEKAPKRRQNQELHSIPGNKYASGKSKSSKPREMNKSTARAAKPDVTPYRGDKSKQNRGHGHNGNQPGPKHEKRGRTKSKGGESSRFAKR